MSSRDVWMFLAFSHGWTWACWALASAWGTSVWEMPAVVFFVIGGAGVFAGGIVMSRITYGPAGLTDLWRRLADPRRASPAWWAVALLLYPVVTLAALAIVRVLAPASQLLDPAAAAARVADPLALLATMLFILVIGPLPEEIGWRGYLLDRLQVRWSAIRASLTLAVIWWSWHLPLFVLPGYFDAFGRGAPSPLDLLYGIVPSAVLYTWVYNNTRRSVLAVVALHFMQNFTGELLGVAGDVRTVRLGLEAALALLVLVMWGPVTLTRHGTLQEHVFDH